MLEVLLSSYIYFQQLNSEYNPQVIQDNYYANYDPCELKTVSCKGEKLALVTAYSEIDSCHYFGCPMANGRRAEVGYIACPRNIPLGQNIRIDNVVYKCGDRYNSNLGERYDIFMGYGIEAHQKAIAFGKQLKEISYE